MMNYDEMNRALTLKYAPLREALTQCQLFEPLDFDGDKFSANVSHLQDILIAKGASQTSIDAVTEAIWLAVCLGVRDREAATQLNQAFEEILGVLCDR